MELSKFFKKAPLVPIICQDERNGEVLMLGTRGAFLKNLDNSIVFT